MILRLVLLTLSSAAIGWLTIFIFTSLLLRRFSKQDPRLIGKIAKLAASQFPFETIASKISDTANLQLLTPELDKHIDNFLRIKLKESMPVVGMFIGDKTINQLKELFMRELESLFPTVMNSYLKNMEKQFDPEVLIRERLSTIPPSSIYAVISENFQSDLRSARILGTMIGLVVGLLQSIFIFLAFP